MGYLNEQQAFLWAEEGVILDLTPHFRADPEASNRLAASYYNYDDGTRTIGTNTAAETTCISSIILRRSGVMMDSSFVERHVEPSAPGAALRSGGNYLSPG